MDDEEERNRVKHDLTVASPRAVHRFGSLRKYHKAHQRSTLQRITLNKIMSDEWIDRSRSVACVSHVVVSLESWTHYVG